MTCGHWRHIYNQSKVDAGKAASYIRDLHGKLGWWDVFADVPLQRLTSEHLEDMQREMVAKRIRRNGELVPLSDANKQKGLEPHPQRAAVRRPEEEDRRLPRRRLRSTTEDRRHRHRRPTSLVGAGGRRGLRGVR
jgi:hypothetical protein